MANFNSNYFYDVPPTQQFEEYGVYADSGTPETNVTYAQSIYTILYSGVTSFEINGTTYFNYNVYEAPALSSYYYDSVCSDVSPGSSTKDDDNVNTEPNGQLILANVNLSENYLNEYCEEQQFIYQGNRVLDWTVDVEDDDIKEAEEEEKLSVYEENQMSNWRSDVEIDYIDEEDIDIVQENFSTINDRDLYQSKEAVKYLKENLYLYALSGHMHLKESVPVVDILPIIEEESELEEENDSLEETRDDLEEREEIIFFVKEKNIASDMAFDTSIHNYAFEAAVENLEQAKENDTNLLENDVVSDLTLDTPEPFIEERNLESAVEHLEQAKEEITNRNDFTSVTSDEKTDLFGGNVSRPAVTDRAFNAVLQKSEISQLENKNISNLQNDRIKIIEEYISTGIEPSCFNDNILLNPTEEGDNRKEITLNPMHSKHRTSISCTSVSCTSVSCYDLPETASQDECFPEAMLEKTMESNGKVSSKGKKKKFQSFRKWLSNLFCCARKEN